jgi:hypothetical protein
MDLVNTIHNFINRGFDGVRTDIIAIIIALIIVFAFMKSWGQLLIMTVMAVVIHLIIQALIPLTHGGKLIFPPVTHTEYWMGALALFIGYLIMILVLFFLKYNVFKMGRSSSGSH